MLQFDPGFYTKIRIDDNGDIVGADFLEESDLPDHKHSFKDITDPQFVDERIKEILSTFFADSQGSAVKFEYDKNTGTISADVDIDGISIRKNEWGQLESNGSTEPSTPSESQTTTVTIKDEDVKKIVREVLQTSFADRGLISFDWDPNTNTFSADLMYDGITLRKDEYGNLMVGDVSGTTPDCASHSHTSASIEDFNEAVINIFNEYKNTIDVDIAKFIDGTTIKINKYGQLTAVSTALEKHTHTLADISDYTAPLPAALQPIKDLGDDVDYKSGAVDLSELNLGYSILALSRYIEDSVNVNIEKLSKRIQNITNNTNTGNGTSPILSVLDSCISNNLLDTSTNMISEVYYAPSLVLWISNVSSNEGNIVLQINEKTVETIALPKLSSMGAKDGHFETINIHNHNTQKDIKIEVSDFIKKESAYSFVVKFENEETLSTNKITLFATPKKELKIEVKDITPTHIIKDTEYYGGSNVFNYQLLLEESRFINDSFGFNNFIYEGVTNKKEDTLLIPNLFNSTPVKLHFEKENEESTSFLYENLVSIKNGFIVNDVIDPEENCECSFILKGSENKNTIKLLFDDDISNVTFIKGAIEVSGKSKSEDYSPGFIKIRGANYFTFGNSYDPGDTCIEMKINPKTSLDISKWNFEFLNL